MDYIYLLHDDTPLPISLTAFTADAEKDQVTLNWTTESETENAEFIVYRDGMILDRLAGAGTTSEENTYSYTDYDIIPGNTYTYSLADRSLGNVITEYKEQAITVTAESNSAILADNYIINSAYPNPFNPLTTINYSLNTDLNVRFTIYDVNGGFVQELAAGHMNAGAHSLTWNAMNTPAGIYVLRSNMGGNINSQKLLLLK